jgi:hypothetical protein
MKLIKIEGINMRNTLFTLFAVAAVLGLGACETTPTSKPPGEYKTTTKSTNAAGTETTKTTNTNVYYDEQGNKKAVQETETSRDPEGLFNKSTSKSTKTYN